MYKKALALIMLIFLISTAFAQVSVEKVSSMTAVINDTITVTIKISVDSPQSAVDIVEFVPLSWKITNWDVSGYNKSNVAYDYVDKIIFAGKERSAAHWRFKDVSNQITITYTTNAATADLHSEFLTVWTYPGGFKTKSSFVTVLPKAGIPYCGNMICDSGENMFNCPQDCPAETQIKLLPVNLTLIIALAITGLIITFITYEYREQKEKACAALEKERLAIEDLRAFLKLGLRRGYTIREMVDALRGANVDVSLLEEIARSEQIANAEEEIKKLLKKKPSKPKAEEAPQALAEPEDEVIARLKQIISSFQSDSDVNQLVNRLESNGINTEPVKIAHKELKKKPKPVQTKQIDGKYIKKLKAKLAKLNK